MIKLKDILNEGKQRLNEVIFYGDAKVVLTSNAKDAITITTSWIQV